MKMTELLLTQRHEAELLLAAAIIKCRTLDESLAELVPVLLERVGWRMTDPLVQAAWSGLTRAAQPYDLVLILGEIERRKATIDDVVRAVQETGATDLAIILAALDKKKGSASANN